MSRWQKKSGRSGEFDVVALTSRVLDEAGDIALEERQDLVYRTEAPARPLGRQVSPLPADGLVGPPLRNHGPWAWDFQADPVALMRFSAASCNAHRIHYDHQYATETEGYPALVVQGPLITLALAEVIRSEAPGRRVTHLAHRNMSPLFCGQRAFVRTEARDDSEIAVVLAADSGDPHTRLEVRIQDR